MIEVELKARLDDPAATEARVASFARFVRKIDKIDSYWHGPDWRTMRGTKGFRMRLDDGSAIVTFKTKRTEGGIEINREGEFVVSDKDAFIELVERIGCEPYYRKRKTGKQYDADGYTVELIEVGGIGDFIEIEKLLEVDDPHAIALAQGGLKTILSKAGVPESAIEGRTYSELLLGNRP